VYARKVNDQKLTFVVSGQLWNRSLVMMDQETKSLWSHILGECVKGKLKDTELVVLPSDMLTWEAWKKEHPDSTVLNMHRTSKNYTKAFYKDPKRFVVGFMGQYGPHHILFSKLQETPLINVDARGLPLLILSEPESTSVRLFIRRVGKRELTFEEAGEQLRDTQTKSLWDRRSGTAVEGELKGTKLEPHVGIISFTRAWKTFHSESRPVE
jgi:hypothetical protein